jgi:hypothetical protein
MRIATAETDPSKQVNARKMQCVTNKMPSTINLPAVRNAARPMKKIRNSSRPVRNKKASICRTARNSSPKFRKSDRAMRRAARKVLEDYLWKMTIRPRIVAALMSQGADLCHGCKVFASTVAVSFFSSLGMFKFGLL